MISPAGKVRVAIFGNGSDLESLNRGLKISGYNGGVNMAKRKKYYTVKSGRQPVIYTEWFGKSGAEPQVKGFPGAVYKGFPTREHAEEFLGNDAKSNPAKKPKHAKKQIPGDKQNRIIIYIDGGCINNPGPGGYFNFFL
jgi:ribonuclease HI